MERLTNSATPTTAPDNTSAKKPRKGLIAIIAAVAVVAVLVVLFFAWIKPTFLSDEAKYARAMAKGEKAASTGELDEAAEQYKTAVKLTKDDKEKIAAWVSLADAYKDEKEYEDAIEAYEAALDIDEDQKRLWSRVADCYIELEEFADAADAYRDGYKATGSTGLLDDLNTLIAEEGLEGVSVPSVGNAETNAPSNSNPVVETPSSDTSPAENAPSTTDVAENTIIGTWGAVITIHDDTVVPFYDGTAVFTDQHICQLTILDEDTLELYWRFIEYSDGSYWYELSASGNSDIVGVAGIEIDDMDSVMANQLMITLVNGLGFLFTKE